MNSILKLPGCWWSNSSVLKNTLLASGLLFETGGWPSANRARNRAAAVAWRPVVVGSHGPRMARALRAREKGFVRIVFQQTHRVLGSDVINAGLRAQRPVERAGNTLRPHDCGLPARFGKLVLPFGPIDRSVIIRYRYPFATTRAKFKVRYEHQTKQVSRCVNKPTGGACSTRATADFPAPDSR